MLTDEQAATDLFKPVPGDDFEFFIPRIEYALDGRNSNCTQMTYLCAEFGKGDMPNTTYNLNFTVEGVESVDRVDTNERNLRTCSHFPNFIGKRNSIQIMIYDNSNFALFLWLLKLRNRMAYVLLVKYHQNKYLLHSFQ